MTIINMKNIGIKIEDKDEAMALMCSLPPLHENFVVNVKAAFSSKDLKKNM